MVRVISRKYSNTKNSTIFNSMIETFDDEELLEKRVKLFSTFSKESALVDTGILSKKVSDDRKKLKFLFFQVSFDNFVKDSYL